MTDYIQKPTLNYKVSMGVYVFNKSALNFIPENKYFDFPDLIKVLLNEKMKVKGYLFSGHWLDIGRPDDYELAAETFEKSKSDFLRVK